MHCDLSLQESAAAAIVPTTKSSSTATARSKKDAEAYFAISPEAVSKPVVSFDADLKKFKRHSLIASAQREQQHAQTSSAPEIVLETSALKSLYPTPFLPNTHEISPTRPSDSYNPHIPGLLAR
jgi:hypothetical protein